MAEKLSAWLEELENEEDYFGPEREFPREKGVRPNFRVLQSDRDKEGKPIYTEVGAMWRKTSKKGRDFYLMKIGNLKLLVFENR
ncbi:MAG: DUF736 family protein [Candidatus Micrarchaeia archaeon]